MLIMSEEIFGPAIPFMTYKTFAEAIQLFNDNKYDLGAVFRSNDARLVKNFLEEVRAGTIWINDPLTDNCAGPIGGMKMIGNARELGLEGLDSFLENQACTLGFFTRSKGLVVSLLKLINNGARWGTY